MQDILWIGVVIGLLAITLAYARLCERREAMNIDLILAAITAIGLLVYLVAALLRPERF